MQPDDEVCLCRHVSLRKLTSYLERVRPERASQLSDCLGAGTGCGWCVPTLEKLHECFREGRPVECVELPSIYAANRAVYKEAKRAATPAKVEPNADPE
ncbi:MAG: (2Fe-2S)-binding protein [Phycisphaerales bacterium]|nr:(2Fe-2S)-binding protein [Phycisphaerales bacterium]